MLSFFPQKKKLNDFTLRIQVCPILHSYSKNGIVTLNPILGRGLDS